jgi:hypothetical protein
MRAYSDGCFSRLLDLPPQSFSFLYWLYILSTDTTNQNTNANKLQHPTTSSRSPEMIFRNENLNPVSDDRRLW